MGGREIPALEVPSAGMLAALSVDGRDSADYLEGTAWMVISFFTSVTP